jgi:hypothetical protein
VSRLTGNAAAGNAYNVADMASLLQAGRNAIVVRPAARSVGASPAAPLGGIWQHEQVQTGEQEQGEREQRQEAHPDGILPPYHDDEVDDDAHRKDNGQPAVGLPNPFVPVQRDLLSTTGCIVLRSTSIHEF